MQEQYEIQEIDEVLKEYDEIEDSLRWVWVSMWVYQMVDEVDFCFDL